MGSLLFEEHLFGVESRFSVEFGQIERRVEDLQAKVAVGDKISQKGLSRPVEEQDLDKLEELVAKEDARRGDGSDSGTNRPDASGLCQGLDRRTGGRS